MVNNGDSAAAKRHGDCWRFRRRWRRNGGGSVDNDGRFVASRYHAPVHATPAPRSITHVPSIPGIDIPGYRALQA